MTCPWSLQEALREKHQEQWKAGGVGGTQAETGGLADLAPSFTLPRAGLFLTFGKLNSWDSVLRDTKVWGEQGGMGWG